MEKTVAVVIRNLEALRRWCDDRVPITCNEFHVMAVAWHVAKMPTCPAYGEDWTEFLAQLPEVLTDLIDEME